MYQTMSYEAQMDMKAEQVKNILNEAVNGEYLFEGVKASPKEFAYRNKMEFSFGDEYKDGPLTLGLHKKGSTYDVLTASDCKLVHDDMTKIVCWNILRSEMSAIIRKCSIQAICVICCFGEVTAQEKSWSIWLQLHRKNTICLH